MILIENMWSRIVHRSRNTTVSPSLQEKSSKLLSCFFDNMRPADKGSLPVNSLFQFNPSLIIGRQKHSQTQIKRLFKGHPARLRVEKRMWNIDRTQPRVILTTDDDNDADDITTGPDDGNFPAMDSTTSANTVTELGLPEEDTAAEIPMEESPGEPAALQSLLYPPVYTIPAMLPNGWFLPMDPKLRPEYPFSVRRTRNKPKDAIGFLPIYTKYRKDGTKIVTRIKNITGDINVFVRELRIVLSLPQPANQLQSYDTIRLRAGNMVEIKGHRATEVRRWLGQLGF